jgi:hypothetical protein
MLPTDIMIRDDPAMRVCLFSSEAEVAMGSDF